MRTGRLVLALLMLAPGLARAQAFSLNESATVTTSVSMANAGDLIFASTVIPGITATVTPANGGRTRLTYNEPVNVTVPLFVTLTGPASSTLRVDLTCAQAPVANAAAPTPFPTNCSTGYTVPVNGNQGGTHYIYVGGVVSTFASNSAVAGNYAGTFTVTATYSVY